MAGAKQEFKKGDDVAWKSMRGKTEGTVEHKVTHDTQIKGHKVKASANDPQYVVKSKKTGAEAAHKPKSLTKK